VKFLTSSSKVVHTYASWSLERVLLITDDKKPRFSEKDLSSFGGNLLSALFSILKIPESQDNEYAMRAILRVTVVLKGEMSPFMKDYISSLTGILSRVCNNSKNPIFNRLLFESYASVIKFNPQSVEAFENALFPPFFHVLQTGIEEFTPFVFQILSQLLEIRETASDTFLKLLPNLLETEVWENTGNIPGLVRLLTLYLKKAQDLVVKQGYLEKILAIFEKLVQSKIHDHEGFYILNAVIEYLSM
jgi:exportin-2 (importin alpha re-exporter)